LQPAQTLCVGEVLQNAVAPVQAIALAALQVPHLPLVVSQTGPFMLAPQSASLLHSPHAPELAPAVTQTGVEALVHAPAPPPKLAEQATQLFVLRLQTGADPPKHSLFKMQPPQSPAARVAAVHVAGTKALPTIDTRPTDNMSVTVEGLAPHESEFRPFTDVQSPARPASALVEQAAVPDSMYTRPPPPPPPMP